MEILILVVMLFAIILKIVIGNKVTYKDDFTVVSIDVTTPEAGDSTINAVGDINYPTGFNRDNCVIISLMSWNHSYTTKSWGTVGATGASSEIGYYGLRARLMEDKINVQVFKVDPAEHSKTITIRAVLMKI